MLTCFIGTYRFNIKYFFWRAGTKVWPCNPSTSQLYLQSSSPGGSAEYWHSFGSGSCYGLPLWQESKPLHECHGPLLFLRAQTRSAQEPCAFLCCPSAASGREGSCCLLHQPVQKVTEKGRPLPLLCSSWRQWERNNYSSKKWGVAQVRFLTVFYVLVLGQAQTWKNKTNLE